MKREDYNHDFFERYVKVIRTRESLRLDIDEIFTQVNLTTKYKSETCKSCTETIQHLFWECIHSTNLWNNLQQWINDITKTKTSFTLNSVLFGIETQKFNNAINSIIMCTKYYIYRCKQLKKIPNIIPLKKVLIENYNMENFIATRDQNTSKFLIKWGIYRRLFEPSDAM